MNRLAEERFGKFFDSLLSQSDMSGAEAARRLRVAQSQVSRWRRGEGGLSQQSLQRISEVFGTDLNYLREIAGLTDTGPSVYRADAVDPLINARLDAVRARARELLEGIPTAYWATFLESSQSMIEELARAYEGVPEGTLPRPQVPTRGTKGNTRRRVDRPADSTRNARIRSREPEGDLAKA